MTRSGGASHIVCRRSSGPTCTGRPWRPPRSAGYARGPRACVRGPDAASFHAYRKGGRLRCRCRPSTLAVGSGGRLWVHERCAGPQPGAGAARFFLPAASARGSDFLHRGFVRGGRVEGCPQPLRPCHTPSRRHPSFQGSEPSAGPAESPRDAPGFLDGVSCPWCRYPRHHNLLLADELGSALVSDSGDRFRRSALVVRRAGLGRRICLPELAAGRPRCSSSGAKVARRDVSAHVVTQALRLPHLSAEGVGHTQQHTPCARIIRTDTVQMPFDVEHSPSARSHTWEGRRRSLYRMARGLAQGTVPEFVVAPRGVSRLLRRSQQRAPHTSILRRLDRRSLPAVTVHRSGLATRAFRVASR